MYFIKHPPLFLPNLLLNKKTSSFSKKISPIFQLLNHHVLNGENLENREANDVKSYKKKKTQKKKRWPLNVLFSQKSNILKRSFVCLSEPCNQTIGSLEGFWARGWLSGLPTPAVVLSAGGTHRTCLCSRGGSWGFFGLFDLVHNFPQLHMRLILVPYSESEVAQSCPTLCDPVDCSPSGSSVHGIFQARIVEWVVIFFSCHPSKKMYLIYEKWLKSRPE